MLCNDFYLIESLVKVYRVKSSEFVEIYFGKRGMIEDHMEEIWSCGDSDNHNVVTDTFNKAGMVGRNTSKSQKSKRKLKGTLDNHEQEIIICDDEICRGGTSNELGYHNKTDRGRHQNVAKPEKRDKKHGKEFKINNLIKEECRTIAVAGEYALEKCQLLQKLSNELTSEECKLCVDFNSKEVTIIGKNMETFQKCLNMFLLQIKMFHCEVLKNLNKRLFHILTQNENVKKHFSVILAENQLDSVVLFEDGLNRPAVLGLNKIKTRNFIEWFGKFFVKVSSDFLFLNLQCLKTWD